jgi:hypothetical protein
MPGEAGQKFQHMTTVRCAEASAEAQPLVQNPR